MYSIKEIFYSLQGEGYHTGRPAVFCRFTGCNLWTGREEDRATAACNFCDTDFRGTDGNLGAKYDSTSALIKVIQSIWPDKLVPVFVVLTGGEPMLQVDNYLIGAMHKAGFYISIETNGTKPVLPSIDWITVSPKPNCELVQNTGDELKLVYPQQLVSPTEFEELAFDHFYLQPMDGEVDRVQETMRYCLDHPKWKLSLQTHKYLGIE